eukprot:14712816-Alexandrium_andersonii.AAC.1
MGCCCSLGSLVARHCMHSCSVGPTKRSGRGWPQSLLAGGEDRLEWLGHAENQLRLCCQGGTRFGRFGLRRA